MDAFMKTWYGIATLALVDTVALLFAIWLTYRWLFKRVLDFLVSVVCLAVVSPFYLTAYIRGKRALKRGEIESVFCAEEYVCKKGRIKDLHTFQTRNAEGEIAGKYGAWLQRTRFYALPRLWDVFCGRLSFIGAKPFTEAECGLLSDEEMDRCLPRPGLINPLVLRGNEQTDYAEMLDVDKEYAWNFSFFGDCKIFFAWLLKKIRGEGNAYLGETRNLSFTEWKTSK